MKSTIALATFALISLTGAPSAFQEKPAAAPSEWEKKVIEAKAITDETKKGEAMVALVREALGSKEVRLSGTAHADQVHPEDNQPAPAVNFDPRMNLKNSYATQARRLETSPAYYFLGKGTPYVVLGPRALDPRGPAFTRMQAEHELFHAKTHVGDPRPVADRELETWTHVFVTSFHEVHPFKQKWAPLVTNYEEADPGERKAALDKLVAYYRTPTPAVDDAGRAIIRTAFDEWLSRRKKDADSSSSMLVHDLEKALAPSAPDKD
ncbi:MAG: hypothetical protein H0W08_16050 [Acidobacteria bacterium]|nr:hypothetical protein [Acidobacteriota bacterium]